MQSAEMRAARRWAAGDIDYVGVPSSLSMVRRIARTVRDASPEARLAGRQWYRRVARLLQRVADHYGLPFDTVAGVFAVTSPRVTVARNVWLTVAACEAHARGEDVRTLPGLADRLEAAADILAGDRSGLELDGGGRLTDARKVRSFAANLGGDTAPVTVDVWAARVAGVDLEQPRGGAYVAVAEAYRRAAARVGLTARECQAVAWCGHRQDVAGIDPLEELADLEGLVVSTLEREAVAA